MSLCKVKYSLKCYCVVRTKSVKYLIIFGRELFYKQLLLPAFVDHDALWNTIPIGTDFYVELSLSITQLEFIHSPQCHVIGILGQTVRYQPRYLSTWMSNALPLAQNVNQSSLLCLPLCHILRHLLNLLLPIQDLENRRLRTQVFPHSTPYLHRD